MLLALREVQLNAASCVTMRFPLHVFDVKSFSVPTTGSPVVTGSRLALANHPEK
jgi:hypothetical protein